MDIKTKLDIGNIGYFMLHNKVYSAEIIGLKVEVSKPAKFNFQQRVTYEIKENPAGSTYTCYWTDSEMFGSKEELLATL